MGKRIILNLALLMSFSGSSLAQVTSNVLQRVFKIASNGQGTAFTIDVYHRQYLVTAAHLLPPNGDSLSVKIAQDGEWKDLTVSVLRCPNEIDIAVLIPPARLSSSLPLEPTSDGMAVGQDVLFLGFPYGLSMSVAMFSGHPLALVKKGVVSGFLGKQRLEGFLLDGMNVKGFSGGPIVFRSANKSDGAFRVAGVIGGYVSEKITVIQNGANGSSDKETGTFVNANTGLAYGFDIKFALDVIKKKPTGPKN